MKKTQIFYNTSNMYAQTHQPNSIQWVGFYISDRLGWKKFSNPTYVDPKVEQWCLCFMGSDKNFPSIYRLIC